MSDCHARSLRGCKSVLLFFCILRAKRGRFGVLVVGKGNVASIGSGEAIRRQMRQIANLKLNANDNFELAAA